MKKLMLVVAVMANLFMFAQAQYTAIDVNSEPVSKSAGPSTGDLSGNVILTGSFQTTITIGGVTLTNSYPDNSSYGNNASWLAKMAPDGSYAWVKGIQINNPPANKLCGTLYSGVKINGVTTDVSGNVVITGYFYGSVTFGTITLLSPQKPGGTCQYYAHNMFTAKLSSTGSFLWAKKEGGAFYFGESGYGVTTDASGNVYTTGNLIQKEIKNVCNTQGGYPGGVFSIVYVVKYGPTGTKLWEKKYTENTYSCFLDNHGSAIMMQGSSIFVAGNFYNTVNFGNNQVLTAPAASLFLLKLDASGNTMWAKAAVTNINSYNSLLADSNGQDVFVSGRFNGTATFGTVQLTTTTQDQFLARYSDSGVCVWALNAGRRLVAYWSNAAFQHPDGTLGVIAADPGMPFTIKQFSTDGLFVGATTATNVTSTDRVEDITAIPDGFAYSQLMKGSYDFGGITIASVASDVKDIMLVRYGTTPPMLIQNNQDDETTLQIPQLTPEIKAYPNPATDELYIELDTDASSLISIHDQFGNVMWQHVMDKTERSIAVTLDGKYQNGVYVLRSLIHGKISTLRFAVSR